MNKLSDLIAQSLTSERLDESFLQSVGFQKDDTHWYFGGIYLTYWEHGGWRVTIGQKDCMTERLGGSTKRQSCMHLYFLCLSLGL